VIGQKLDIDAGLESVIGKSPYGAPIQESTSSHMLGTLDLDATFSAELPTGYHLESESGVFLATVPEPGAEHAAPALLHFGRNVNQVASGRWRPRAPTSTRCPASGCCRSRSKPCTSATCSTAR
jgi:hypothetical protein